MDFKSSKTQTAAAFSFTIGRKLEDGELLFLVNTSLNAPAAGKVISPLAHFERWNLETGETETYLASPGERGLEIPFTLPPGGSRLLFLAKTPRDQGGRHSACPGPTGMSAPPGHDPTARWRSVAWNPTS